MKEQHVIFEHTMGNSVCQIVSHRPDLQPEHLPWDEFYRVGWAILHAKYGPDVQFEKEPNTK